MVGTHFYTGWLPQQYIGGMFTRWWDSLLKTAFFAPILMALLWATLQVAKAIPKTGSLGNFITNPTSTLDLNALFSYVMIVGLLAASFYAAKMASQSIPGFGNVGSALRMFGGIAAVGSVGLASRFGVAPLWRRTGGRYFARRAMQLEDEIDQRKMTASTPKD